MAAYPGRGNPVMDALRGDISTRQLRVMVENLPPDNAAARLIRGAWGDLERLVHDVSCQLRLLNASYHNVNREKGKSPIEDPELLPTPEEIEAKRDDRPVDVVQAERDHLQLVLHRQNPR